MTSAVIHSSFVIVIVVYVIVVYVIVDVVVAAIVIILVELSCKPHHEISKLLLPLFIHP